MITEGYQLFCQYDFLFVVCSKPRLLWVYLAQCMLGI